MFPRFLAGVCTAFLFLFQSGAQTAPGQSETHAVQRTLVIGGVGRGIVPLDGAWQFMLGDNPAWSKPDLDDNFWEQIRADDPWGAQGHALYTGFAWYRRHVDIRPTSGETGQYRILIPLARDAYEVYWNGELMGRYGRMPPRARWYYSDFPRSFPLVGSAVGVLAIRVWKAPLDAFSDEQAGGLFTPPLLGDPDTITLEENDFIWQRVQQDLFDYSLVLLRVFLTVLCVVLYVRNRKEGLFLWVGIFTIAPVAMDMLENLFLIPWSYEVARCLNQPLYVLYSVSLWFLLVWLLELHGSVRLVLLTRVLAWIALAAGAADGILAFFWGSATVWMQWADGVLAACILLLEVFPFLLIAVGLRSKLDTARWAVALSAAVLQMLHSFADATALGQRFTHWSLYDSLIDTPLFTVKGVQFPLVKVTSIALFAAIIFALYRYILEQQARRSALEQEIQSAREIQQVLIPETLPELVGYALTSAYTPANEVGGDFFQVVPNRDGSTLVALGDVSGKGLKAAMNVAMIVGVLRAEADKTSSPAEILHALSRCLAGRMSGGFATGIVLRLDPAGVLTLGNAGHLPPFLNGQEFPLEPSLPLGLIADTFYSEISIRLLPGDRFDLYTDGIVEAQNAGKELFGFARMAELFAARPTAQEASQAAVDFGQMDDITVLTLTRLAAGEKPVTKIIARVMETESTLTSKF